MLAGLRFLIFFQFTVLGLMAYDHAGAVSRRCPLAESLSPDEVTEVGQIVLKNETGGDLEMLVFWNKGEEFPSLGPGHFIWFPENWNRRFKEVFPEVLQYVRAHLSKEQRALVPHWLDTDRRVSAPWSSYDEFQGAEKAKDPRLRELRNFLKHPVIFRLQVQYMIDRANESLDRVLRSIRKTHPNDYRRVMLNVKHMTKTTTGVFSIIDYVNFKGDGTDPKDATFSGARWGLKQVLLNMQPRFTSSTAQNEFADSVIRILSRRARHEIPHRRPDFMHLWEPIWTRRANRTYRPKK